MTQGTYILPEIPPYCREVRIRATLIETRPGNRVYLRDEDMAAKGCAYFIETDAESFIPDTNHGS